MTAPDPAMPRVPGAPAAAGPWADAQAWLFGAALVLPWLWPLAPGPSVHAVPLLASWALGLVALALWLSLPAVRERAAATVAGAWLVAALISSAIALGQWFGWSAGLPGISGANLGEAYGNLRQRNQMATLTSIGLLALLALHALHLPPAGRGRTGLLPWALAAVLLGLACAATVSRTGLVQWLCIVATAVLMRPGSRPLALAALAAYAAGALLLPWALAALQDMEPPSLFARLTHEYGCSSRSVLWDNMLTLIAARPWTGWGAGELDYAHFATLYPGDRFCEILDNAHNLPLHVAVEFGLPLAVALFGALAWCVWRGRPWAARAPLALLAWGVLAVIALHSLLEYPLWYGPFQLAVLLALGLLVAQARGPRPLALPATARALGLLAVAVGAAALWWALDCYRQVSQAYLPPEERLARFRADPLTEARPGPFTGHADFARLTLAPLTRANAAQVLPLALRLLHFSPEPKVVEAVIESALLLGQDELALWHLARFKAAFPREHLAWAQRRGVPDALLNE